jgi:hypothetical protein
VFLLIREYDCGTASAAALYFSNANNESATRSDEEFEISTLAASEFKKTL